MSSKSVRVCARMLSTASAKKRSPFQTGINTEICGDGIRFLLFQLRLAKKRKITLSKTPRFSDSDARKMKTADPNLETALSPLSRLPPKKIRDLPKKFLLEQLELYYKAKPPEQVVETDYALWECAETGLQFAWPT